VVVVVTKLSTLEEVVFKGFRVSCYSFGLLLLPVVCDELCMDWNGG
jgi:hypothetical protein